MRGDPKPAELYYPLAPNKTQVVRIRLGKRLSPVLSERPVKGRTFILTILGSLVFPKTISSFTEAPKTLGAALGCCEILHWLNDPLASRESEVKKGKRMKSYY